MEEWSADICNDPNDDYNLIIEILHNDQDVAVIKRSENGPMLTWYAANRLTIPVDWLLGLLQTAKERII